MFHIKSVLEAKFYEEGVDGKVCPLIFSISAWGERGAAGGGGGGPGGAKICQSQVSPFQGGQGFASTICNALREFQHCQ